MKMIETFLTMALVPFLMMVGCTTKKGAAHDVHPQFVIEREIPGAGKLTNDQLKAASEKSCEVLRELGPEIQWLHSYVTADKVYCVYTAPSKDLIIEHARKAGVPANLISEVSSVITPETAR